MAEGDGEKSDEMRQEPTRPRVDPSYVGLSVEEAQALAKERRIKWVRVLVVGASGRTRTPMDAMFAPDRLSLAVDVEGKVVRAAFF